MTFSAGHFQLASLPHILFIWNRAAFQSTFTFTFNPIIGSTCDSHGHIGELLLGEVEGVIGDRDAILAGILSCWQISSQDGVVGHTEEGHHAVPSPVVEPHLRR